MAVLVLLLDLLPTTSRIGLPLGVALDGFGGLLYVNQPSPPSKHCAAKAPPNRWTPGSLPKLAVFPAQPESSAASFMSSSSRPPSLVSSRLATPLANAPLPARVIMGQQMGRNLYILAATLLFFALAALALSFTNLAQQPGSPGDVMLWRTMGIAFFILALVATLAGTLSHLFGQAERRAEQARRTRRRR